MFASQLLRILQTLPSDVKHDIRVLDTANEKPTMKGNQNGILSHSNGYKEEDSLGFPTSDFANSNVYHHSDNPLSRNTKDGNDFWKVPQLDDSIFFDDISGNNNNEIKAASSVRNDQNIGRNPFACDIPSSNRNKVDAASVTDDQNGGLPNIIPYKRAVNPFECDTKDRDQPWNIPEYECSMIVDFLDDKENGAVDTDSPFTSHSELFETHTHSYTDKGVTDHDLPELAVCYRESNLNIVKDIRMDEGEPAVDKVLIETWKDDQPGMSDSVGVDEDQQSNNTRESIDMGSITASVPKDSSVEDEDQRSNNTRESIDMGSLTASVPKESSVEDEDKQSNNTRGIVDMGSLTASLPKDFSVEEGAKSVAVTRDTEQEAAGALVPNGSEPTPDDNANNDADKDYYLEDLMMIFGSKLNTAKGKATTASERTPSSYNVVRSVESNFKNSQKANSYGDQSAFQPDQIPIERAALKSQIAAPAADETNSSGPASNLFFTSNSTKPEVTNSREIGVEKLPEDSQVSKAISVHKDGNPDNLSAASHNVHQQSIESQNVANLEDHKPSGYPVSKVITVHKDGNSDDISVASHNVHHQFIESQTAANLEDHKPSGYLQPIGQGHFADGEASFSALGPASGSITFAEPISYSGSISLRSDSSTTSARSFAFPVLQSEWNSSPVRMAKAERRRLRKQKGWKQGILCCRF